jgi:hypothetical protein
MDLINQHKCRYDVATRHLLAELAKIVDEKKRVYIDPGDTVPHWRRGADEFKVKLETASTVVIALLTSATEHVNDIHMGSFQGKPFIEIYVTKDIEQVQKPRTSMDWEDDFN